MEVAGIKPQRLALDWASAAEASLFVELITKFTDLLKELGPLGEAERTSREELKVRLLAARSAVKSVRLRTRFGKLAQDMRKGNGYAPDVIEAKMAEKLNDAIIREIEKQEKAIGESRVS